MQQRGAALHAIIAEQKPMTVRQVFYQATVRGLIDKTEKGYGRVATKLQQMRRAGELPYEWLTDNTRSVLKYASYNNPGEALIGIVEDYRRTLWGGNDPYVQIWLEKDALSGVIDDVISEYDVSLLVSRGYASMSFLHDAGELIADHAKATFVYHLGDHDPSGVDAARAIEADLRGFAPEWKITFQRLAVTERQIKQWKLPSRPTKETDTRTKTWSGGDSVELDAIEPNRLRQLLRNAIDKHMPKEKRDAVSKVEQTEREQLRKIARKFGAQ
jgi:hypothetical protein